MRLIMLLVMITGALLAFGYTAWIDLFQGEEIGRFSLSARPGPAAGPTVYLDPSDAPVAIELEVSAAETFGPLSDAATSAVFRVGVSREADPVSQSLASFRFSYAGEGARLPIQADQRRTLLHMEPVIKGDYRFAIARTDAGAMPLRSATLLIRRKALVVDERIQPAGFLLLVLGGVGFFVLRRRHRAVIEPRPPRENRWGRQ